MSNNNTIIKGNQTSPQLTVYKASAGSGKTFTLAKEYMTLIIDDPMSYRTILAVTFTNKATEEMKTRILSKLYAISRQLEDGNDYLKEIIKALPHLSEQQIIQNAGIALSNLIHNYNYFRVETIDTFFQSVLRNLARELDLTANLRIGLNDEQVEQQAVDELIESLSKSDKLLLWIMDYIKENIAEDKGWNVMYQIKDFGMHIFKDYYKEQADRLNECIEKDGFFEAFSDKLKKKKKNATDYFDSVAATFFDALEENGLSADNFQGKTRGIWSYFNKLRNGKYFDEDLCNATVDKCCDAKENWVTKANAKPGNAAYDLVDSLLYRLLYEFERPLPGEAMSTRHKLLRLYKNCELTTRHLNQLRLLGSIDNKVREINKEANRFLLSDTQTLLHSLVQDSDSPFIFEKIGTQLEHIMIDEFQDTSTVQWKNFKVLLQETMSHENASNLIVGDVKQSIYRWRSGDWRLLNNIETQFPEPLYQIKLDSLSVNYRSDRQIIDFNNAFFRVAAKNEYLSLLDREPLENKEKLEEMEKKDTETLTASTEDGKTQVVVLPESETDQLRKAYAKNDVVQGIPEKKASKGFVRIHLINNEASKEADAESYQDQMLRMTLETIQELVDKGVRYDKIAVLVRSNRIIQQIADYLMQNSDVKLPLVSDEAFRLDASLAVNILVNALYYLTHPDNDIMKATILKFAKDYPVCKDSVQELMANREELLRKPLLDLVEKLYCLFHLSEIEEMKDQSAYVCAFFDKLSGYLTDNGSDIEGFLEEWESNLHNKSIHSDKADGIRLLTIHKSKGLEFDNVIMPFCDWKLEMGGTIWCTPDEEPYNELPLVPVDFNAKKMKGSIYEKDYDHEHLQNMVDNLNLLYVAFTRAGRNLFVYGKRGNESFRSNIIEKSLSVVKEILEVPKKANAPKEKQVNINLTDKEDEFLFEYGEIDTDVKEEDAAENANVFLSKPAQVNVNIKTVPELREFTPSKLSEEFVNGDDMEEQQKFYIKLGTVLHALFSTIKNKNDVEKALNQLELDGVLYDENVSKERIKDMLNKRFNSPLVSDWFSDKWTVMNECSILYYDADGKVKKDRPDRVLLGDGEVIVIDFKFGKPKPEYHDQVRQYMTQISSMGYGKVKGYLWYVYPNKVEEVFVPQKMQ